MRRAFTLIELMVVIAIIAALAVVASVSWKAATAQSVRSLAVNTLTSYISVARSYALMNQVETMLVVNPYDGRLELWRANPPTGQQRNPPPPGSPTWEVQPGGTHADDVDGNAANNVPSPQFPIGGEWDIESSGDGGPGQTNPAFRARANGYAFVPLFDSSARLPVDANGKPRVMVNPIDFAFRADPANLPPDSANTRRQLDNLTWTALCFDADGQLVVRARRIDMNHRGDPAQRADYQPLTTLQDPAAGTYSVDAVPNPPAVVHQNDALLLSTLGVVVSEAQAFQAATGQTPAGIAAAATTTPAAAAQILTNPMNPGRPGWLDLTLPGQKHAQYAEHILLNQWSGRPLQSATR